MSCAAQAQAHRPGNPSADSQTHYKALRFSFPPLVPFQINLPSQNIHSI
jgi:hypothetical protein